MSWKSCGLRVFLTNPQVRTMRWYLLIITGITDDTHFLKSGDDGRCRFTGDSRLIFGWTYVWVIAKLFDLSFTFLRQPFSPLPVSGEKDLSCECQQSEPPVTFPEQKKSFYWFPQKYIRTKYFHFDKMPRNGHFFSNKAISSNTSWNLSLLPYSSTSLSKQQNKPSVGLMNTIEQPLLEGWVALRPHPLLFKLCLPKHFSLADS